MSGLELGVDGVRARPAPSVFKGNIGAQTRKERLFMARMKVFISHSHRDAKLAGRFEEFLTTTTSKHVEVKRSSKEGSNRVREQLD